MQLLPSLWGEHRKLLTQGWLFSPWALDRGKTTSRQLTTWCSSHMKAVTVLLYRNYSKMFITWIFCVGEDNNRKCKYGNGLGKKHIFNTRPVVRCCRPGNNILSPSLYIYIWVAHRVVSPVSKLSPKHPNYLITFIKNNICKV